MKFQIGDRVIMNRLASTQVFPNFKRRFELGETAGKVVGKGRVTIFVQFDFTDAAHEYAERFFDPEPPQPAPGFAGGKFTPKFLGNPLAAPAELRKLQETGAL